MLANDPMFDNTMFGFEDGNELALLAPLIDPDTLGDGDLVRRFPGAESRVVARASAQALTTRSRSVS
jgi:hypothetical protein